MALTVQAAPDPELNDLLAARPAFEMHARDGLCFEYVPLNAIAEAYGTPVWVYGAASIRARYGALTAALAGVGLNVHVHYAVKANDHIAILDMFRRLGAGADVVSQGEFLRARHAGIAAKDVVFSGVGKGPSEIAMAIAAGIGQINVESAEELMMVSGIASQMNRTARVALRMNPDVDAGTHEKITTGLADNKFGIPAQDIPFLYTHANHLPNVQPVGIAMHIGSQILSPVPYTRAYRKAAAMVRKLREIGQSVSVLDLGGGLGIGYGDEPGISLPAFASLVRQEVGDLGVELLLELGRYLIGPAGVLLASVVLQKYSGEKRFLVLDVGMNDLIRPAMYDSWHGILPLSAAHYQAARSAADIVGPICETGDSFAAGRLMPEMGAGSRVAILDAGAYGAVMSSHYNARPRAAAVLVAGGGFSLITPRQSVEELWAHEVIPGANG